MTQRRITDDLHALLGVLPPQIAGAVTAANNSDNLLEVVIDLGRHPVARFTTGAKAAVAASAVTGAGWTSWDRGSRCPIR